MTVPVPTPAREIVSGTPPSKVATTFAGDVVRVTSQVPAPLHAPLQPVKCAEPEGVAVTEIFVPGANPALQVDPQLMPLGLLVIVPAPVPFVCTVRIGSD